MYSVSLNGTDLKQHPQGFEKLICTKTVSDKYHGFLRRKTAFVESSGDALPQLTFTEKEAIFILISTWERYKHKANVVFGVKFSGETVFEALVDYETASWDQDSFTCAFKDDETVSAFISGSETEYEITPTERCKIFSKDIENQIDLSIPEIQRSIRKKQKSAIQKLRLNFRSETEQNNLEEKPFYYVNNTESIQTLQLNGLITGTFTGFSTVRINLESQSSTLLTTATNNSSNQELALTISHRFTLNAGQGFYLTIAPTNQFDITAVLSEATYLQLQILASYPDSYAAGLNAESLLLALARKTNPLISLSVTPELSAKLRSAFITSGKNIRGYVSPFKASLSNLFEALDIMFAIRLDMKDNTIYLSDFISSRPSVSIPANRVRNITYSPLSEYLFSSIQFGFETWKSEDFLGALEYNSIREYESGVTGGSKLTKRCSLIASGQIIESIRKQQFVDSDTSTKDNKHDQDLFVISSTLIGVNEYEQNGTKNYSDAAGIFDIDKVPTNLDYMPERLIHNWVPQLKSVTDQLIFASGEGNYTAQTKTRSEASILAGNSNVSTESNGLDGKLAIVEYESSIKEYNTLPEVIKVPDGLAEVSILVQSAIMPFETASPVCVVQGYVFD